MFFGRSNSKAQLRMSFRGRFCLIHGGPGRGGTSAVQIGLTTRNVPGDVKGKKATGPKSIVATGSRSKTCGKTSPPKRKIVMNNFRKTQGKVNIENKVSRFVQKHSEGGPDGNLDRKIGEKVMSNKPDRGRLNHTHTKPARRLQRVNTPKHKSPRKLITLGLSTRGGGSIR